MNKRRSKQRSRREAAISRILMLAVAVVLVAGLFAQITMLARISSQSKQVSRLEKEITELSANAENLELSINQYHNLENIAARAQQLGMEQPDATQIRVVNVVRSNSENTSTQAVELIDMQKVLN